MSTKFKNQLKKQVNRNYIARDFDAFRAQLLEFARIYFPDKIKDFSEPALGGLLLDMPAFIGDTMSFYLDHQFNELDFQEATESINIERHLKNASVEIRGKSPASTYVRHSWVIPAIVESGVSKPDPGLLPKLLAGSTYRGTNGVSYVTGEDVDFGATDFLGELIADVEISETNADGSPNKFKVTRDVDVTSGKLVTETFSIPDTYVAFRKIALTNTDVSGILSVYDTDGNDYYEVTDLSQDTVFRKVDTGAAPDESGARSNLEIIPAPYRFVRDTSLATRLTSIKFGSGDSTTIQDQIIPDPSELALPLYGKSNFSRFTIDPKKLLETDTLGIAPRNTTITITYRSGGGRNHNIGARGINTATTINVTFPGLPTPRDRSDIMNSVTVFNPDPARGGDDALTAEQLRSRIPSARNAQARVVTRQDLLARVYTMPDTFGRVYRAGVNPNAESPLASDLFIISLDENGNLATASDVLKKNLRLYLNEFRLISEAIEIKDVSVINFGVNFSIISRPNVNKLAVLQSVISRLSTILRLENFQVDQPIIESDIIQTILSTQGVVSLAKLEFFNLTGDQEGRSYSDVVFDPLANSLNGLIIPPAGSMFELKFANYDIIGNVI